MTVAANDSQTTEPPKVQRSLWRNRDFMILWAGESASMIGSSVTYVAFPLVAALYLHASAWQMGLIATAGGLPSLVFGLFVGALVDRLPQRALMLCADLGRMLLTASIPAAALLHQLSVWQLVVCSFLSGALTLTFTTSYQAFFPEVVSLDKVTDGNGKLAASQSFAEVVGPGIAGVLMSAVGVPAALLADAASFLASALGITALRTRQPARARHRPAPIRHQAKAGFSLLRRDPVLLRLTASTAVVNFSSQMQTAVYFLFLGRSLHLSPGLIGTLYTASGVIGLLASLLADRIAARIGLRGLAALGQWSQIAGAALLAVAYGSALTASVFILGGEALFSVGMPLFAVGYSSLRQQRIPPQDRGKVIGASRLLASALLPVAGVTGGVIGSVFSLRAALLTGAVGMCCGGLLLLRGPEARESSAPTAP
jgi:MFS family permease